MCPNVESTLSRVLSAICVAAPGAQEALTTKQRDADLALLASICAKQALIDYLASEAELARLEPSRVDLDETPQLS
jgi:hypothetical protein